MKRALSALQRVREIEKKQARQSFADAERARIAQEVRVDTILAAVEESRGRGAPAEGEAVWAHMEHAFRLRMEVQLRSERSVLEQRAVEVSRRRAVLNEATRATRVVEVAIERIEEMEALEARRADGRRLDALAGIRWWRENES
jgi:hypothetical protein